MRGIFKRGATCHPAAQYIKRTNTAFQIRSYISLNQPRDLATKSHFNFPIQVGSRQNHSAPHYRSKPLNFNKSSFYGGSFVNNLKARAQHTFPIIQTKQMANKKGLFSIPDSNPQMNNSILRLLKKASSDSSVYPQAKKTFSPQPELPPEKDSPPQEWFTQKSLQEKKSLKSLRNGLAKTLIDSEPLADTQRRLVRFPKIGEQDYDKILGDLVPKHISTDSNEKNEGKVDEMSRILYSEVRSELQFNLRHSRWSLIDKNMTEIRNLGLANKLQVLSKLIRHYAHIHEEEKAEFWFKVNSNA